MNSIISLSPLSSPFAFLYLWWSGGGRWRTRRRRPSPGPVALPPSLLQHDAVIERQWPAQVVVAEVEAGEPAVRWQWRRQWWWWWRRLADPLSPGGPPSSSRPLSPFPSRSSEAVVEKTYAGEVAADAEAGTTRWRRGGIEAPEVEARAAQISPPPALRWVAVGAERKTAWRGGGAVAGSAPSVFFLFFFKYYRCQLWVNNWHLYRCWLSVSISADQYIGAGCIFFLMSRTPRLRGLGGWVQKSC